MKYILSFLVLLFSLSSFAQKRITDVNSTRSSVYSYIDENDDEVYIIDITSLGNVTIRVIDAEGEPKFYKTKNFDLKSRITKFYKTSGVALMIYKNKIIKYHYKSGQAFEIDLPENFLLSQYINDYQILDDGILVKVKDNSTSNQFWEFLKNDGSIQSLENEIFLIKSNNQYALFKVGNRIKVFDLKIGKTSEISVFGINTTVHSILSNNKFFFVNQNLGVSVIDLSDSILNETILDIPPLLGNHIAFFESKDQVMVTGLMGKFHGYVLDEQSLNVIQNFSFDIKVPLNADYKVYYDDSMFYLENLGIVYIYNTSTDSLKIIDSINKDNDFLFLENGYILIDNSGFIECHIPKIDSTYEVNFPMDHEHLSGTIGHNDLIIGASFNSDLEKKYFSSKVKTDKSYFFKPNYDFNMGLYKFGMRMLSVGNDLVVFTNNKLYAIFENSYILVGEDISSIRVDDGVLYCIKSNGAFTELYKFINGQLILIMNLHQTFEIASFKEITHGIIFNDIKQNLYYYNFEQDQITLLTELISFPSFNNSIYSHEGNVFSWQTYVFSISDQGEFKHFSNIDCKSCSGVKFENAHFIVNQYSNTPIYSLVNGEFEKSPLNSIFESGGNVVGIINLGNKLLINYHVNDSTTVYQLDSNGLIVIFSFSELLNMTFQNEDLFVYSNLEIGYVIRKMDMKKIKIDDFSGSILDVFQNEDNVFMLMLNYEASLFTVNLTKFNPNFTNGEEVFQSTYKNSIYRNKHFFYIDSLYVALEDKLYNVNNLNIDEIEEIILLNENDAFVEHKGLHYYIGFEDKTGYQVYLFEGEKTSDIYDNIYKNKQNISVYPNPTSTTITLKLYNSITPCKYEIYNNIGLKCLNGYTKPNETIDVNNLHSGIYYLIIQDGKKSNRAKFIKM